jgi:8-oxo-dGTP pyrophosphatase MutT (NUDIX family)
MTPAPSAGGEEKRKKSRRRRPRRKKTATTTQNLHLNGDEKIHQQPSRSATNRSATNRSATNGSNKPRRIKKVNQYSQRVDEVSAGGLVLDITGKFGLLIARRDLKNQSRLIWSLPKGHIEEGETPEIAAIREVAEETGITSEIHRSLGVIDFWFMASGKRIHKTVHHFLFREVSGSLQPQVSEVDDVAWIPLEEIISKLAYPDEKKLIARSGELKI